VLLLLSPGIQAQEVARVPETDGPPVLLDGTFSPGEWADAVSIDAGVVGLFLKQEKGHVLLGVRCRGLTSPVVDLYVEPLGGEIHQLHASAQLGERTVPSDGSEPPPFTWGRSPFWYANEVRWDEGRRRQLINEGMEAGEAQMETLFPYDGFEFQIRRDKFGAAQWRVRLEVWSAGGNTLVFPAGTRPGDATGWLVLDLEAEVLTSASRLPD
jgi:hypothetical protein